MTWEIVIPLEVPSQNEADRCINRMVKAAMTRRARSQWAMLCRSEMLRAGVRPATGRRRLHILATRIRVCRDIANLVGGAKPCIDGLVDAGLLKDDGDAVAIITYQQRQGRPAYTTLTITEDSP